MMYKGISIRLTADLSAETVARRKYQDILEVMKGKKPTNKITLPRKNHIRIRWRNQKHYKCEEISKCEENSAPLHQLCNENIKGTFLGRKLKGRIRSTETNSKQ